MSETSILLFAILACTAALSLGCGNQALSMNAEVARAMLEVQSSSGPVIRGLRVSAGVEAGRVAHESGATEEQAQAFALRAANRWNCAIDGHRIYSGAVGAYIDALALWNLRADFQLADALPFVSRAIDAYRFVSSCLNELGSDALPELPSFFDLIPGSWSLNLEAPDAS